ncbi:MAG: transcription elongation factor GreB [Bdellovibrionota bacterium]
MSKAFVKESDGDEEETEVSSIIPAGTKNYITPVGAERLKAELKALLYEERPKVVQTVSWAASNGDRSENGDYIYGKRRLREIDRRIRFLTKRIQSFEIVDPSKQKSERILFGAKVTIEDEDGKKKIFQIVGIDESDPAHGKVSWISPIAKAVLNKEVGDVVNLRTPRSEEELEIVGVKYE